MEKDKVTLHDLEITDKRFTTSDVDPELDHHF